MVKILFTTKIKNMSALERLGKVKDESSLSIWWQGHTGYSLIISDIQEAVALAKANQQPNIDSMRFEAAKAFLTGIVSHKGHVTNIDFQDCVNSANRFIAELQNQSHDRDRF